MPTTITSFDQVPQETVDQLYAGASAMMRERHPEVELARGPFGDLVLYLMSTMNGVPQVNIDRLRESMSLLKVTENPDNADPDTVDAILSNVGITRKPGALATGEVTIIVSSDNTVVIPANLTFLGNGVEFIPPSAFTARPTTGVALSDTDRVLSSLGDGTYAFTIPLDALAEQVSGNIRRGTTLTPASRPERFVRAFAAVDFIGGSAAETNAELIPKLTEGMAAKSMGGLINWQALIRLQPQFERVVDLNVRGYGDAEQMRDQHSIIPISLGGRVDLYLRSLDLPRSVILTVEAVLVADQVGGGVWQFTLDSDVAPGFYEVENIRQTTDEGDVDSYEIILDERGYDLDRAGFIPDITTFVEAAYTRYQTAVIRFIDTDTSRSGLTVGTSTREYAVAVLAMPLVAELQDFAGGRDHRCRPSDVLVRAAVPCFVNLGVTIRKDPTTAAIDVATIKNALAAAVNTGGFRRELQASTLIDVIHSYLSGRSAVSAIDLQGRIRAPDATPLFIRGTTVLELPYDPQRMVTGETTAFILDPRSIDIAVITVG